MEISRSGIPGSVAQRATGSGLLNERAPLQTVDALYRRVCSALSAGRSPLVYGGHMMRRSGVPILEIIR